MPIDLTVLGRQTEPKQTILLFGAGSSIPSGGMSGKDLALALSEHFDIDTTAPVDLPDVATIVELKRSRRELVDKLTQLLSSLQPERGLLNLPDYDWAGLYTTNYDTLIEKSFNRRNRHLHVISSNFDFDTASGSFVQQLYKLHGSIGVDISLGHQHRMVISTSDYDLADDYRELLYAKFTEQLYTSNAIIIGHSLSDPDLRTIVDQAIRVKRKKGAPGSITLLIFEKNDNQALIYENRGLQICFAGIDEFFAEMSKSLEPMALLPGISDDPLERARDVYPSTISVSDARNREEGDLSRMFSGSAASYADISRGWTFWREFSDKIESQLADNNSKRVAFVLGAAGTGKTTGVRRALMQLSDRGIDCWEHDADFELPWKSWARIDSELRKMKKNGVLFIDNAHEVLHSVNLLVDEMSRYESPALKLVLVSSKPNWNPRLKTPAIFLQGQGYELSALVSREIESLLTVLDTSGEVSSLVEQTFLGFSRLEQRRRLEERCRSDMFVCMKNIFASESLDEIILREFAELSEDYQELYKKVAGMESAGVRVHRQLVIRSLHVRAEQVSRVLEELDGIIREKTVNAREGIYSWRIRHGVIADIVAKYKYAEPGDHFELIENIVDNLNPSYDIEVASINDMCDLRRGLGLVRDKGKQNVLLRKMVSLAPRQRVPRHRLITNLIRMGEFEAAEAEIRLFEKELRPDGPVRRYKVELLLERARSAIGIMDEDRGSMVLEAVRLAEAGIAQFRDDKNMYRVFLEAGVAYLRYVPDRSIFDRAMQRAESAYERILDPELGRIIRVFRRREQRFSG